MPRPSYEDRALVFFVDGHRVSGASHLAALAHLLSARFANSWAGMEDDVSNARERSFAEIWSRAQRDRSRYLRSWLNSAIRQLERWLTCRLANARHKQRARRHNTLEHDPEKWIPVFGKDHAPPKGQSGMTT